MKRARKSLGAVSVVEAAYAEASSEDEWLANMLAAAAPDVDEGLGCLAYVYDAARAPVAIGTVAARDLGCSGDLVLGAVRGVDEDYIARTWRRLSFGLASQIVPFAELPAARCLLDAGVYDMLAVNAFDPSGAGVWLGAPLPRERSPRPREAETWTRIASHVAAAFRLRRRRVTADPSLAAAVLQPNGRLEHARDAKDTDRIRKELSAAVLRMERARCTLRDRDPDEALALWRTLVDGRLTLLDAFERDGRRYVVAVENAPCPAGPADLTDRERQVAALIATGRTTKLAAYELGLSDSTVRVLLTRAARKLRAKDRKELVAIVGAHLRAVAAAVAP